MLRLAPSLVRSRASARWFGATRWIASVLLCMSVSGCCFDFLIFIPIREAQAGAELSALVQREPLLDAARALRHSGHEGTGALRDLDEGERVDALGRAEQE